MCFEEFAFELLEICVCMYVCMYVCMCMCVCMCVCMYVDPKKNKHREFPKSAFKELRYVNKSTPIPPNRPGGVFAYIPTCIHTLMAINACMHVGMYADQCMYACSINACRYVCMCICMYACMYF